MLGTTSATLVVIDIADNQGASSRRWSSTHSSRERPRCITMLHLTPRAKVV